MKEYILIIKGEKGKEYFECRDMKEVETRIFERSYKILNFEIYKTIENKEITELLKISLNRLLDNI